MSCANCKHWRTGKVPNPLDPTGICVKLSADYRQREGQPEGGLYELPRTKRRRGKSRHLANIMVTYSPGFVDSLGVHLYTDASFHCSFFEPTKKRRLPVLNEGRPSRLERVAREEG